MAYQPSPYGQPMPPPYQPTPQPPPYQQETPLSIRGISPNAVAMIVIVGIIIFFVGAIICNASVITKSYGYGEADTQKADRENARNIYKAGTILADVGALIGSIGMFYGALVCRQFDNTIRVALLSVATAIIVVTLIIMLLGGPFGAFSGST